MKHRWLLGATVGFLTLGIRYQIRLGQPGDVNPTVRPLVGLHWSCFGDLFIQRDSCRLAWCLDSFS